MNNDSQTTESSKAQAKQEPLDRRQFFNGLGKWSLAIIAGVTALGGGSHNVQDSIGSRFEAPSADLPGQRIARHGDHSKHADIPHGDAAHGDATVPHIDMVREMKKPPPTTRPPGPSGTESR